MSSPIRTRLRAFVPRVRMTEHKAVVVLSVIEYVTLTVVEAF